MFNKILLAYDGSEAANKAFAYAKDLAGKYQSTLHVLAVARPPDFADDVELTAMLEKGEENFEAQFDRMRDQLNQSGVTAEFHCLVGHPAERIVRYAEEHGADLIVVGHRGLGLFDRWLLGSTSRAVLAYARCAVMVVR